MKKLVSLALALALCLSLSVPVLAAPATVGSVSDVRYCCMFTFSDAVSSETIMGATDLTRTPVQSTLVTVKAGTTVTVRSNKDWFTKGYDSTTFGTNDSCRTSQILTFLYRASGSPNSTGKEPEDVYAWAVKNQLVADETSYISSISVATHECDRWNAILYIWKVSGRPEPSKTASFTDISPKADKDAVKAISWAVEKGVTTGYEDGTFRPNNICTRGQIAAFLYRAMK